MTSHTFVSVPVVGLSVDTGADDRGRGRAVRQDRREARHPFRFAQGAVRWADVGPWKLLRDHDVTEPIGKAPR